MYRLKGRGKDLNICAQMVESVDTQDLKSCEYSTRVGSSPTLGMFIG